MIVIEILIRTIFILILLMALLYTLVGCVWVFCELIKWWLKIDCVELFKNYIEKKKGEKK